LSLQALTIQSARGSAPWGFLAPPAGDRPGIAVFAQVDMLVRVTPSGGPPGAFSAQGSREAAAGAAYMLGLLGIASPLRAMLHCPEPRRLYAARGAALLGALAAARSAGLDPARRDLELWADAMDLGWSPAEPPGQLVGAWLGHIAPRPDATWPVPQDPRLLVAAAQAREGLLAAVPELAPIWREAQALGAEGLTFDPQHGHVAVLFAGGNAPQPPRSLTDAVTGRVGRGYAWS
jgi:hypothetical protein